MGGLFPPNTPVLRRYQHDDVERIRSRFASGVCRVCYQLPTGGGKTIAFCFIVAASVAKGTRVLILAHRTEILEQIDRALTQFGVPHGIIAAGYPSAPNEAVQVASVFTLALRPNLVDGFDFVIVDEAHHSVAATWKNILAALSGAKVLGVTATPERLDGKGLNDIFEELICGPSVGELIDQGFLAPFTAFGPKAALDLDAVRITRLSHRSARQADVRHHRREIGGYRISTAVCWCARDRILRGHRTLAEGREGLLR